MADQFMGLLTMIVDGVNDVLWGYVLMYALVGVGIFFTLYLGAPQFIRFGPAVRQVFGKLYKTHPTDRDGRTISSFQALAVAISAQVGTGNVAGVATAIMAGGPGAIFWMWLSALFGMSTIFSEAVLAQRYRKEVEGRFIGGPAFYISRGLKHVLGDGAARFLAAFFAVSIIIALGFIGVMVQSNSIAGAVENAFQLPPLAIGIVIALFAGAIFIGGIQRIA
ncbi:MAG: alanine:cation symporter family protein, partial [Veillonellaceae bacterium]|nr:alanine:cation symporter family protein [Veillonellaceae bacterium]